MKSFLFLYCLLFAQWTFCQDEFIISFAENQNDMTIDIHDEIMADSSPEFSFPEVKINLISNAMSITNAHKHTQTLEVYDMEGKVVCSMNLTCEESILYMPYLVDDEYLLLLSTKEDGPLYSTRLTIKPRTNITALAFPSQIHKPVSFDHLFGSDCLSVLTW